MDFSKTSNPTLGQRFEDACKSFTGQGEMTFNGTVTKTFLLFLLVVLSGSITWKMAMVGSSSVGGLMIGGLIGGLIFALICSFKPEKSYIFAPLYSLCEGLTLGAISAMFNSAYEGIVLIAVLSTFGVALAVFACYRYGILRATGTFVKVISFATLGICVFYLLSFVIGLFGVHISVTSMGPIGIVIQLVIVAVAALNLVLDFDTIEKGVNGGAPAYMEWYGAFSIMVTLVWLYLEILRLLSILNRRN